MPILTPYKARPIRFLEIQRLAEWQVKVYSISHKTEYVKESYKDKAMAQVVNWLKHAAHHGLETYNMATLILHECKEGCFAVISWWTDENMIQNLTFLSQGENTGFEPFADNEIVTCAWEIEILWFERNAWIEHVLKKAPYPDYASYIKQHLNLYSL